MTVHYEDLAMHPERTMQDVCARLGLEYEKDMLRYWAHDHHHIFGNGGTRYLIYKYRRQFAEETLELRRKIAHDKQFYISAYYDELELTIQQDMRWRIELAPEHLEVFNAIAGNFNKAFAYPLSMEAST